LCIVITAFSLELRFIPPISIGTRLVRNQSCVMGDFEVARDVAGVKWSPRAAKVIKLVQDHYTRRSDMLVVRTNPAAPCTNSC